jgi:hypothetical protein
MKDILHAGMVFDYPETDLARIFQVPRNIFDQLSEQEGNLGGFRSEGRGRLRSVVHSLGAIPGAIKYEEITDGMGSSHYMSRVVLLAGKPSSPSDLLPLHQDKFPELFAVAARLRPNPISGTIRGERSFIIDVDVKTPYLVGLQINQYQAYLPIACRMLEMCKQFPPDMPFHIKEIKREAVQA